MLPQARTVHVIAQLPHEVKWAVGNSFDDREGTMELQQLPEKALRLFTIHWKDVARAAI